MNKYFCSAFKLTHTLVRHGLEHSTSLCKLTAVQRTSRLLCAHQRLIHANSNSSVCKVELIYSVSFGLHL